jgi:pseudouridine-5'-phosphate glycosidase
MLPTTPKNFVLSPEVARALRNGAPVVALESTVITHGLPHPENLTLAQDMHTEVRKENAAPATVAVLDGRVHIGLEPEQLEQIAALPQARKISSRDLATAIAKKLSGGTTVAGTLLAAHKAGLRVFATGGIGGVHRESHFDVSADLGQLAKTPMVVVCAGAKAILDLPATVEYLETLGVPVLGYETDEFPAFYSRESGLPVSARADSPEEVAAIAKAHWDLNRRSAILVCAPLPESAAIPAESIGAFIRQASEEAQAQAINGQALTPFLLARIAELSEGKSLQANLALLKNNARIAAQISQHFKSPKFLSA